MEEVQRLNQKVEAIPKPEEQAADIVNEPPTAIAEPVTTSDSAQVILPPPPADDAPLSLRLNDTVQVYDRESQHWGLYFTVGDIRGSKVHGYYFQTRGEKSFVTFDIKQLRFIGTSRVRSKACCSPKWVAEHNMPRQ